MEQNEKEVQKMGADSRSSQPSPDGGGEVHCPICGRDVEDRSLKRFGQYFCSEAHVAEYAREIRSRQPLEPGAFAAAGAEGIGVQASGAPEAGPAPQKKGGIGGFLKMAACCGGMLLLLPALGLVSVGGLASVAGSGLAIAAALACPLGMYFMMRGMMKMNQGQGQPQVPEGEPKQVPSALQGATSTDSLGHRPRGALPPQAGAKTPPDDTKTPGRKA